MVYTQSHYIAFTLELHITHYTLISRRSDNISILQSCYCVLLRHSHAKYVKLSDSFMTIVPIPVCVTQAGLFIDKGVKTTNASAADPREYLCLDNNAR